MESFHQIYWLSEERAGRRSWKGCERVCWKLAATTMEPLAGEDEPLRGDLSQTCGRLDL